MIIDLYGLPGSGKTYLGNELERYFQKKGIKAKNITNYLRETITGKILKQIAFLTITFNPKINKYFKILKNNALVSNKNNIYYLKELSILIFLYKKLYNKKNIFIFDEGVYHTIIKLFTKIDTQEKDVLSLIKKTSQLIPSDIKTIYLKTSTTESFKSIRRRDRHSCPFDELNDRKLNTYLEKNFILCEKIDKNVDVLIVKSKNYSIEKILKKLRII